jgi:two-component system LytT family sensor kinase
VLDARYAPPMSSWLRHMASLSLLWAVPGALTTGQFYLLDVYRGVEQPLLTRLLVDFLPWQVWALATPLVVAAGRRWPPAARWLPLHLLLNALIALGYVTLQFHCAGYMGMQPFAGLTVGQMVPALMLKGAVLQLMVYWGVIAVDWGLAYQRRSHELELQHAQLEARLVEAQLDTLRVQLRPHFLFNTLNAIAVLVRKEDGPGAIKMISGLSDLLRRSLGSLSVELVTLREELDFITMYIDIALVRFSDRLTVRMDIAPAALEAGIPSLLLQPLVENALEHGIAPLASGGCVEIVARVEGEDPDTACLHLEIRDDGAGLREGHREGVGLSHVRKRLAQLYPGRHRFSIERQAQGTRVLLELPLEMVVS